jgi:hypothetical protein
VDFPAGLAPPQHVRIYRRRDHFVLQWWDKTSKRTASERVDGDLLAALIRARELDERRAELGLVPTRPARRTHEDLIRAYSEDLTQRTDAGEIDETTRCRYVSALNSYREFTRQSEIERIYRHIGIVDRRFQMQFAAFLLERKVSATRQRSGQHPNNRYELAAVAALYEWAKDPNRGGLLSPDFQNPFIGKQISSHRVARDVVEELRINVDMAVQLVEASDAFQLQLMTPLFLYGLRPGELSWLFSEDIADGWLKVDCIPELGYFTKGRREKRFPILPEIAALLEGAGPHQSGLLLRRCPGRRTDVVTKPSRSELIRQYQRQYGAERTSGAAQRRKVRDRVLRAAGQIQYDDVEGEFRKLAAQIGWPRETTLKDLRHLFSTCLENAGVPVFFRRYFMGHSPGRSPISVYTHLTTAKVQEQYEKCLSTELAPVVAAIRNRIGSTVLDAKPL